MKIFKTIINTTYWVFILAVIFLAVSSALVEFNNPLGLRMFVVQSGSMEPTIQTGALVLIKSQPEYQVQDIITFKNDPNIDIKKSGSTTTHRIVEIKKENEQTRFVTKGDANNAVDSEQRNPELVLGKVLTSVPKAGFLVSFAQTQLGFVVLIVIPATLIVYSELMNIKTEFVKMFKQKSEHKQDELEE